MSRKNWRAYGIAMLVIGAILTGFYVTSARAILSNSQQFTLYSLDPQIRRNLPGKKIFHQYSALGQVEITDARLKTKLIDSLYQAINAGERDGNQAACFNPRHGIRAVWLGQTVDVVICFECSQVVFHKNGSRQHSLVSPSAQAEFDRVLSTAGVLLSRK